MFRHKQKTNGVTEEKAVIQDGENTQSSQVESERSIGKDEGLSNKAVKELLEKNLKWSQIIYEQNRRINHKLLWSAIAGWLRLLIILVPLALAFLYLPSILKSVWSQYGGLLGQATGNTGENSNSLDSIIKMFNFTPTQKEQIRAMLK